MRSTATRSASRGSPTRRSRVRPRRSASASVSAPAGRGAHLVTVTNYLARRDSQWMGHLFQWLGLTVGCIDESEPSTPERRAAYLCDITYGTNNEFGFDYLRDNMVFTLEHRVQRGHP